MSNTAALLTPSKSASPLSGHSKSSSKKITKKLVQLAFIINCPLFITVHLHILKDYDIISRRDQRMHKLVFENGGLPDGTEVAYYSNGKVVQIDAIFNVSLCCFSIVIL